jgi:hypothetical protein
VDPLITLKNIAPVFQHLIGLHSTFGGADSLGGADADRPAGAAGAAGARGGGVGKRPVVAQRILFHNNGGGGGGSGSGRHRRQRILLRGSEAEMHLQGNRY